MVGVKLNKAGNFKVSGLFLCILKTSSVTSFYSMHPPPSANDSTPMIQRRFGEVVAIANGKIEIVGSGRGEIQQRGTKPKWLYHFNST